MRTVVLAGGRSQRMGFDKLAAPFDGVPLARRIALGLRDLRPLAVVTPAVAAVLDGLDFIQLIVTEPTAGPSTTLALAHCALPLDLNLAVVPCDLPFLDASRVRAFLARVPGDADLCWPVVAEVPGHPVVWSPQARTRILALGEHEPPLRVRDDPALHCVPLVETDVAYVADVDTPEAWIAAEARALRERS